MSKEKDLKEAVKSDDIRVREQAVYDLAFIRKPWARNELLTLLKDKSAYVRRSAVTSLERNWDKGMVQPLIEALYDEEPQVRSGAAHALGNTKSVESFPYLLAFLQNPAEDFNLRFASAHSLGKLGQKEAFDYLLEALKDKETVVRVGAVHGLESLGDKRAIEPIITMLNDPEEEARLAAITALRKFGDISALPALSWLAENDITETWGGRINEIAARAVEEIVSKNKGK